MKRLARIQLRAETLRVAVGGAYAAAIVGRVADLASFGFLVSCVSASRVGAYLSVLAAMQIANEVLTWGLDRSLLRDLSTGELTLRGSAPTYLLIRMPVGAFAVVAGASALRVGGHGGAAVLVALVATTQLLQNAESAFSLWLRSRHFQTVANAIASSGSLARLAVTGAALIALHGGLTLALAGYLVVGAISLCISSATALWLSRDEPRQPRQPLLPSLRGGTPFALTGVMTIGQNRLDWLLVSVFVSPSALAVYGLANKIYELIQSVVGIGLVTVYPYMCRQRLDPRKGAALHLVLKSLIVVAGVLALSAALIVGPVAIHHLPAAYAGVRVILPFFLIAAVISPLAGILYQFFAALRHDRWLVVTTAAATVAQLSANLALIPLFGIRGGAVAMVVLVVVTSIFYSGAIIRLRLVALRHLGEYVLGVCLAVLAIALVAVDGRLAWAVPAGSLPLLAAALALLPLGRHLVPALRRIPA